jgi:hypothetical protein
MPALQKSLELRNTINSHGLFSQMLGKKDVCTFINEVPHSYNFYLAGYVTQVWMPLGVQSRYHSGDVALYGSKQSELQLVECKTVSQWQSSIPKYLSEQAHIKLSMGAYEAKVYSDFVENCSNFIKVVDGETRKTPIDFNSLLLDMKSKEKGFFVIKNMDLSGLRNFIKETSNFKLKTSLFGSVDFVKTLKIRER